MLQKDKQAAALLGLLRSDYKDAFASFCKVDFGDSADSEEDSADIEISGITPDEFYTQVCLLLFILHMNTTMQAELQDLINTAQHAQTPQDIATDMKEIIAARKTKNLFAAYWLVVGYLASRFVS